MNRLQARLLHAEILDCTACVSRRRRRNGKAGTIALWVCVAALVVAYVVFK